MTWLAGPEIWPRPWKVGNKRLSRHLMNGELMSHGVRAISVPARQRQVYNAAMVDLYASGDAGPLFTLLDDVHQSQDIG